MKKTDNICCNLGDNRQAVCCYLPRPIISLVQLTAGAGEVLVSSACDTVFDVKVSYVTEQKITRGEGE